MTDPAESAFYRFRVAVEESIGLDTSDAQGVVDAEIEVNSDLFEAQSRIFDAMNVERAYYERAYYKGLTQRDPRSPSDLARSTGRLQGLEQAMYVLRMLAKESGR